MVRGEYAIPIAKMLTPGGPEPWRYVTPLGYEWWKDMTPLEQAHRERRLFCQRCDRHLLYCCGEVRVPYFRHDGQSCLAASLSAGGPSSTRSRARASMIRFGLARLLLELLPAGTRLDEERAFLGTEEDLLLTLPSGQRFVIVVECSPDGYATLAERQVEYLSMEIPVFRIFAGDLLYRQIREASSTVDTRLDPLAIAIMEWGDVRRPNAEPFVDLGYKDGMNYPFLTAAVTAAPGQLLFYKPGDKKENLGTLIGLRGVLPVPGHQNRWVGAAVRMDVTHGQSHPVRFRLRRGFYFEQDLEVLKEYRKLVNKRRVLEREQKAAAELRAQQEVERRMDAALLQPKLNRPRPTTAPPVANEGTVELGRTHRLERAGAVIVFVPHSYGYPWYASGSVDGTVELTWNGRRFGRGRQITPGEGDKILRQYR